MHDDDMDLPADSHLPAQSGEAMLATAETTVQAPRPAETEGALNMENEGCPNTAAPRAASIAPELPAAGVFIMQNGLLLPDAVHVTLTSFSPGWQALAGSGRALDHSLRDVGWSCFFLAGELHSIALGSSPASRARASGRLLAKVRALACNCAELAAVRNFNFLGIPYLRMSGHARHIQQGFCLDPLDTRRLGQQQTDWAMK